MAKRPGSVRQWRNNMTTANEPTELTEPAVPVPPTMPPVSAMPAEYQIVTGEDGQGYVIPLGGRETAMAAWAAKVGAAVRLERFTGYRIAQTVRKADKVDGSSL